MATITAIRLALALLLALLLAAPAAAKGQPQPLTTSTSAATGGFESILSPLDQQGCGPGGDPSCQVFNTTASRLGDPCVWNDQDDVLRAGIGYVDGVFEDYLCVVANLGERASSIYPHWVYVNVYSQHDTLQVVLDSGVYHWDSGPPLERRTGQVVYRICVPEVVADRANSTDLLDWPEIPFTNGGRGEVVEYRLTVASAGRRTREVSSRFEIATAPRVPGARNRIVDCP